MRTAIIDNINMYDSFHLILSGFHIDLPERKALIVDVPGRDGVLDLTERVYGSKNIYKNRNVILEFTTAEKLSGKFTDLITSLSRFNQKKCKVILSDDLQWYYTGVCTIEAERFGSSSAIKMTFDSEPYKRNVSNESMKSL